MSGTSGSEHRSYVFDWRPGEHARVTSLLVQEQFATGARRAMKWGVVAILVMGGIVAVATALSDSLSEAAPLAVLVIIVAALVVAFGRLAGWLQAWQARRHDPNVAHPITHTLDESGLHVSTRTADIDLRWEGMYRVRETPDLFMFYYSRRLAYYLPKRALASLAEVDELRAWVRQQLPPDVAFVEHSLTSASHRS